MAAARTAYDRAEGEHTRAAEEASRCRGRLTSASSVVGSAESREAHVAWAKAEDQRRVYVTTLAEAEQELLRAKAVVDALGG